MGKRMFNRAAAVALVSAILLDTGQSWATHTVTIVDTTTEPDLVTVILDGRVQNTYDESKVIPITTLGLNVRFDRNAYSKAILTEPGTKSYSDVLFMIERKNGNSPVLFFGSDPTAVDNVVAAINNLYQRERLTFPDDFTNLGNVPRFQQETRDPEGNLVAKITDMFEVRVKSDATPCAEVPPEPTKSDPLRAPIACPEPPAIGLVLVAFGALAAARGRKKFGRQRRIA